jgi:Fe2+ transport system protein FeoA
MPHGPLVRDKHGVRNPYSLTRDSQDHLTTLADAPRHADHRVTAVGDAFREELVVEGIAEGSVIAVASAAPFGGPLVVRVGPARVAVARSVARTILVEPVPGAAVPGATRS